MKSQQIIDLMDSYELKLGMPAVELIGQNQKYYELSSLDVLKNAQYMAGRIKQLTGSGDLEKANRWLGFLQGIMWTQNIYTINEMRNQNRPENIKREGHGGEDGRN